ncbi:metal ABC transporter ATP-binding protein [Corynebacterium sp. AOP40-9SA-29]|uniref:metal ABC transporter ATP-binding protein n=1 Tax=Corynebacterium sp. AOP40-9SA-29 TaxID=3457677 RepID=UPI004034E34A
MSALTFTGASVDPLWHDLDLTVEPGEFLTVLGPNGVGKSTLLNAVLGTRALTSGSIDAPERVGFIPQQRMFDADLPIRVRDLVGLSIEHGMLSRRRPRRATIDAALAEVGASGLADRRVGTLSGGQQQLVRQAQAMATDPQLLLCDEPLLSLDLSAQRAAVELLDQRRREHDTAVVFVTHSINPVLGVTDRILYLGPDGHVTGAVDEVMTGPVLSRLYGTPVDVAEVNGRMVVV